MITETKCRALILPKDLLLEIRSELVEEFVDHAEQQLEIAQRVQRELLPSLGESFPEVRLATEYRPVGQFGGDFYNIFRVQNSSIALIMGDVSGKGVPAALLLGVIHGIVRVGWWSKSCSHHEWESGQLNRFLCERSSRDRFASMFWCSYDPIAQLLRYVDAGHCPTLLTRKKNGELGVDRLESGGPCARNVAERRI